jgi:putative ABC transport system permease protein
MREHLWGDLRIALRSLSKTHGFTGSAITTLGLAIALEVTVIAVVNAYLVRSLPYPAADRLYSVGYARPGDVYPEGLANLDWAEVSGVVEHLVSWDLDVFYLIGGDHPEPAPGAWVTPGFMRGLGIRPAFGRSFAAEEFEPGTPQVALISHSLWVNRFGSDSAVLGRPFEAYVSDRPDDPELFTIVGVLPPDFWHLNRYTEVLTPLRAPSYPYLVRLRERVPPPVAERRIAELVRTGPTAITPGWRLELRPVHREYASRVKPMLVAISVAVSLVLVIAGTNVAILILLRALRRQKEVAVRLALGAGRARLAGMLVTESLLLAAGGSVVGTGLALLATTRLTPVIEAPLGRTVPGGAGAVSLDLTVLAAIVVLTLAIGVAMALAPLVITSRQSVFATMRRGRRGGLESARGRRTRFALVAVEVAGSLALLVGSGLMVRTVIRMVDIDLGMDATGIVAANLALRERSYPNNESQAAFYQRLLAALAQTPGVTSVALAFPPPLAELRPQQIARGDDAGGGQPAGVFAVSPDFFLALGVPLVAGRAFVATDQAASEPVAILSDAAVRRLWPGGTAIGKTIRILERDAEIGDTGVRRTVVGVVGNVRHSPTDEETADVYLPLFQRPSRFARLLLRATGGPEPWLPRLRSVVKEIDPEVAVSAVRMFDDYVAEQLARPRLLASLFVGFGLFATALALMGVYGVMAYAVEQREHEVAVRMAVGADRGAIIRLFASEGGAVLLVGIVAGGFGAVAIGRVLEAQLYGVRAVDLATLVAASLGLAVACGAAIWWPARRASGIDPAVALREE